MGAGRGPTGCDHGQIRQPAGLGRQQQQVPVARHRSVEKIEIGSIADLALFKSRSGSTR
jgi:hypothetical protein